MSYSNSEEPVIFKNFEDPLQPFFAYQNFVLLDGGLATELERHGANIKDLLWSSKLLVDSPDLIQKVHEDYVRSGADIITACSYQATFQGFREKGIDAIEAKELFEKSVKIAKQAIDHVWKGLRDSIDSGGTSVCSRKHRLKPLVAGSLGPLGCYEGSEFVGNYGRSVEYIMDFHRPRIEALLGAEPDLIMFETIPCANEEAKAICNLLRDEFSNVPAILSFSCKNGSQTCCGESILEGVQIASAVPNVVGIGFNCTSPLYIADLITLAKTVTTKPIVVYPNSGETFDQQSHDWKDTPVDGISKFVKDWYQKGATVIGGCCRTTPKDIEEIRSVLKSITKQNAPESTKVSYKNSLSVSQERR